MHRGFPILSWEEGADIMVVNTCTVTSKAEQKARRIIRKALRDWPEAVILITGCYAQMEGAAVSALEAELSDRGGNDGEGQTDPAFPKRLFVLSGDRKSRLLDLPSFLMDHAYASEGIPPLVRQWLEELEDPDRGDRFRFNPRHFAFHSRAFLKIQDGCDNACAYCRVHLARGRSISLGSEELLSRLKILEREGYREAVLTGININQYRDGEMRFPQLITYLLEETRSISLRISSTEPEAVTDEYLRAISHERLRPHFHLSVQSGSDLILGRMARRYNAAQVEKAAELLRSVKDDPFLACDIISGFPGESAGEFEKTYDLCGRVGFSWIHAFPYSPRPGTAAFSFTDRVSEGEAVKRVEKLLDLARKGRRDYIGRWKGRPLRAIAEGKAKRSGASLSCLSDNYLRLAVKSSDISPASLPRGGEEILCKITEIFEDPGSCRFDAEAELLVPFSS